MIKRIVKLTFRLEAIDAFKLIFDNSKDAIRNFEGCHHLELWQDTGHPNAFFTYSWWEDHHALNHYRESTLFKETWSQTKVLFADKPQAWSVRSLHVLD